MEVSRLSWEAFNKLGELCELVNHEDIKGSGAFVMLFKDSVIPDALQRLRDGAVATEIEAKHWDRTKDMTNEEKGRYFIRIAAESLVSSDQLPPYSP